MPPSPHPNPHQTAKSNSLQAPHYSSPTQCSEHTTDITLASPLQMMTNVRLSLRRHFDQSESSIAALDQ